MNNHYLDIFIDAVPFVLYTVLLIKAALVWKIVRRKVVQCEGQQCHTWTPDRVARERNKANLLLCILLLLLLCTLTFMAANAYALVTYETTFLSLRVFQMFVVGNCAAYWLVLDLISRNASVEE